MSFYRRFSDGKTQRWMPHDGEFVDCAPDEPETRVRKPNEGMIVVPAHLLGVCDVQTITTIDDEPIKEAEGWTVADKSYWVDDD